MSSDHPAIRVRNPGNKYTIGGPQENTSRSAMRKVNSMKAPFKRFNGTPAAE